jgi:hypothetical protein
MTTIDHVRSALSAASTTDDPHLRVVYTAAAHAGLAELRAEVATLERLLEAQERELVRQAEASR